MRWLTVPAVAVVAALVAAGWWAYEASALAYDGHMVIAFVTGITVALAVAGGVGTWRRPSDPEPRGTLLVALVAPTSLFRVLPPPGLAAGGALIWLAATGVVVWVLAGRPPVGPLLRVTAWVGLGGCSLALVLAAGPHGPSAPQGLRPATWARLGDIPGTAVQQVNPLAVRPSDKAATAAWVLWAVGLAALAVLVAIRARRPVGLRRAAVAAVAGATLLASVPQRVGAPGVTALLDRSGSDVLLAVALVPLAGLAVDATWRELILPRLSEAHDGALQLDRASSPSAVRRALVRTLDDPSAVVRFPREDGWIDEAGRPVSPPAAASERAWTVIRRAGAPVAALEHDRSVATHPDLVALAATNLALTVEAQRLAALAEADALDAQRSASRTLDAVATARRDVERRIVEGPLRQLDAVAARLSGSHVDLASVHDALRGTLSQVRDIAHGPVPAVARGDGLAASLDRLHDVVAAPFAVQGVAEVDLPAVVETTVLLVVVDAVERSDGPLRVAVAPIREQRVAVAVAIHGPHHGIGGDAHERVVSLGGEVEATAGRLTVTIPTSEEGP